MSALLIYSLEKHTNNKYQYFLYWYLIFNLILIKWNKTFHTYLYTLEPCLNNVYGTDNTSNSNTSLKAGKCEIGGVKKKTLCMLFKTSPKW